MIFFCTEIGQCNIPYHQLTSISLANTPFSVFSLDLDVSLDVGPLTNEKSKTGVVSCSTNVIDRFIRGFFASFEDVTSFSPEI